MEFSFQTVLAEHKKKTRFPFHKKEEEKVCIQSVSKINPGELSWKVNFTSNPSLMPFCRNYSSIQNPLVVQSSKTLGDMFQKKEGKKTSS
ncbi:hypothetical protein CEXT_72871 [Caerostris extrusa]|uniref:Uncharacterized protein n=1 Tax=Caerostris extrusa TaxID=172846 RepID=A0AAV4RYQ8_CAEEX|nr:hypothetical protein CEXT_72871 [Caerostris extrusa]